MTYPPNSGDDASGWSAPGGQWGEPSDPGYGQPGTAPSPSGYNPTPSGYNMGTTPPANGSGMGSTPPPTPHLRQQPGIIPLQPLRMGQIYDGALKAIRANPVVMFLVAGIFVTISTVAQLAFASPLLDSMFSLIDQIEATGGAPGPEAINSIMNSIPAALFGLALSYVVSVILTGILTFAVSQAVLGFKPSLAQVWSAAKGRILPLLALTILVSLIVVLPAVAMILLVGLLAGTVNVGIVILLALVVGALIIAWTLGVLPTTTLATPALMLEGASPITALRRGWVLSKPFFWRILGIYLLTSILTGVIVSFITTPATIATLLVPPLGALVIQGIAAVIASTLVTPFLSAVVTLLYIDVRIRREGLAMELSAASA